MGIDSIRKPFPVPFLQLDFEDRLPLLDVGETHLKDFVEPSATQELRGKIGDVVRCCDHIDRALLFLHPRKKLTEQTGRHLSSGTESGEGFLNLVDPEDAGCRGFRDPDGFAKVLLALSDIFPHQTADVQTQQRDSELLGNTLRGQALSTSGHTDNHDSGRHIDSMRSGDAGIVEDRLVVLQILLQVLQSADFQISGFDQFQQSRLLNRLFLLGQDQLLAVSADLPIRGKCKVGDLFDFKDGEAAERHHQFGHGVVVDGQQILRSDTVQKFPYLLFLRRTQFHHCDQLLQLRRNHQFAVHDQNRDVVPFGISAHELPAGDGLQKRIDLLVSDGIMNLLEHHEILLAILIKLVVVEQHQKLRKGVRRGAVRLLGLEVNPAVSIAVFRNRSFREGFRKHPIHGFKVEVVDIDQRSARVNVAD